ncbi:MAG: hypothetical protein L6R38_003406 [Xanthoria sp. 2 TBL-2021]|nr:MAG: hypothetical protein L6R38_003406 [Xanthoria sp. 2 TBL-2021]
MATVSPNPSYEGRRDNGSTENHILPAKTGLDDKRLDMVETATWRCDSVCMEPIPAHGSSTPSLLAPYADLWLKAYNDTICAELLNSAVNAPWLDIDPPPPYSASVADVPPCYQPLHPLPYQQNSAPEDLSRHRYKAYHSPSWRAELHAAPPILPMTSVAIDLNDTSTCRQVGGNKKKKQAAKWSDWPDEPDAGGANGGAEGGDNAGGGAGGGAANNGDGGAGDDGGGGDDWNFGSGKKKKGKKGKNAVDEEEEKKKKEEEEERKRKEEEEAAAADPLDWMKDGDTKPDDDWGGSASTDKKGKKNKKGKVEPAFGSQNNDFSDINLGDTPKIDLSFGNDFGTEAPGTDFGFGGWGRSWDTANAGNTFGGGAGAIDSTDNASGDTGDTGTWSFGSNKKSKKTTTTSGFDFGNLDTLEEDQTTAGAGQDDWATGFSTSGKKNKKNSKKSALDDSSEANDVTAIGTAVTEPSAVDDSWGSWGTSGPKKDKTKKKRGEIEEAPPVPPPPPAAPVEPPADDTWSALGAKGKKKGKKGAVEEPVVQVPEIEPTGDAEWEGFGAKKDKKKGKKDAVDETKFDEESIVTVGDAKLDPEPEADNGWGFSIKKSKNKGAKGAEAEKDHEPPVVVVPDQEADAGLGWGNFGTSKKDKKKGKKDTIESENSKEPATTVVPHPEPETDLGWGSFGAKKEKKKGKKAIEEVDQKDDDIVAVITDPDPIADGGWESLGTTKTTKKGKGGAAADVIEDTHVIHIPDPDPLVEDTFDAGWGNTTTTTKKGKKDKKGGTTAVKEDPVSVIDSSAATEATKVTDDDWMNSGSSDKKKDKKGKKGLADEGLPPPPPTTPLVIPNFPEASSIDPWATSTTSKKDKKGKRGKTAEPEPAIIEVPNFSANKKAEAEEDEWGTFGLTATEKKKKEKTKLKEREKEEKEKKEREEQEDEEREEQEQEQKEKEKEKEEKEKEKEKAKPGKKGKASATTAASKTKDLITDSVPDTLPAVEEDTWGTSSMWGSLKKDTKKKAGRKDNPYEVPPPVPTPPAQGLTPPPESNLDDLAEDDWGSFAPAKEKDKGKKDSKKLSKADDSKAGKSSSKDKAEDNKKESVEETPAKAARSFWGGMTTATPKSKTAKEKEAETATKELDFDAELDLDEIVDIIEEDPPPKKGSKSKAADSKLLKSTSKDDKASKETKADAEMDALIDFDDLDAKDITSNTADASTKSKGEENKADAFSFWGSSKKTSGKNGDEPKKEINKQKTANQSDPLAFLSNEPEPSPFADEAAQFQSSKPSKSAMSTSKTSAKLSVTQKVKALEEERKKALEPTLVPVQLEPEHEPPAKKSTPKSKTAAATASKSTSAKKKESSPPPAEPKKSSKDSVPGSFPAEGFEEENLIDMLASSPIEKKPAKKSAAKTATAPMKESNRDVIDMDMDEMPTVPAAPPTPPVDPTPAKPAKKERARVVRDEGASSWGFWGAAPKKDAKKATKAKDDADVPSTKKTTAPALVRSKSTKTPKEKDKDTEKSSGSDGKEKKAESRPPKSRGSSFGAFFGGPPPVRTKPVRRTSLSAASKTTSRRQSVDVDAFGLPSPPPEDSPAMTGKAAKVMGTTSGKPNRNVSTKGKQKASAVPDPYPIDDDDMVMVNGIEDPIVNAPIPKGKSTKDKSSRSKPKRDAKPVFDAGDDVVMIDGPSQEEPEILAFDEKPRAPAPLQRSMTSSKKPANGKLMGLFGGFGKTQRNSETFDRPKGKAIVTDDEAMSPRKRTVNSREDSSKRLRRDDRKVRRSEKPDRDADGFITDALNERDPAKEAEDADVRRQERRAKREVRESETRQRSKRADDEDLQRHEEKHSRRSGRDDAPVKEAAERTKHSSSRPHKSDRRRSYMDPPQASDRPKAHRSRTEQSSSKRRSVAVDDSFDPRNAVPEEGKNEPYMHGANDHTSSWVKSQLSDPADPPPVEGTVIEPTPKLGGKGGYADEEARKAARNSRRQSRYGPGDDMGEGDKERRRRRKDKESEGSVEWGGREREKLSRRYTDMGGVRGAVDGRPSLGAAGKRSSWLKKVTGMGT